MNAKKNGNFCINCGKNGHSFKTCKLPVTSYGIILFDFQKEVGKSDGKKYFEKYISKCPCKENIKLKSSGIKCEEIDDHRLRLFCEFKNQIKFLMIQRKHTIGFVEFIRGRYSSSNVNGITFLFEQMTKEEINNISKSTFEELWRILWPRKTSSYQTNEFKNAKKKFISLKSGYGNRKLQYFIDNVQPLYDSGEWGFPKGRRNLYETDFNCALREFREETDWNPDNFDVLGKFCPLSETFCGTNGVNYRHTYYLSINKNESTGNNVEINPKNISQSSEIGGIAWFTYDEALKKIRSYHTQRKKLITKLYVNILNIIMAYEEEQK